MSKLIPLPPTPQPEPIPEPTPAEEIFVKPTPSPSEPISVENEILEPAPVKKAKRKATEKQAQHLERIRAKSLASRQAKAAAKKQAVQQVEQQYAPQRSQPQPIQQRVEQRPPPQPRREASGLSAAEIQHIVTNTMTDVFKREHDKQEAGRKERQVHFEKKRAELDKVKAEQDEKDKKHQIAMSILKPRSTRGRRNW